MYCAQSIWSTWYKEECLPWVKGPDSQAPLPIRPWMAEGFEYVDDRQITIGVEIIAKLSPQTPWKP